MSHCPKRRRMLMHSKSAFFALSLREGRTSLAPPETLVARGAEASSPSPAEQGTDTQDSAKGGAVETGCSGLHCIIGCSTIKCYPHPLHPPPIAPPSHCTPPVMNTQTRTSAALPSRLLGATPFSANAAPRAFASRASAKQYIYIYICYIHHKYIYIYI